METLKGGIGDCETRLEWDVRLRARVQLVVALMTFTERNVQGNMSVIAYNLSVVARGFRNVFQARYTCFSSWYSTSQNSNNAASLEYATLNTM